MPINQSFQQRYLVNVRNIRLSLAAYFIVFLTACTTPGGVEEHNSESNIAIEKAEKALQYLQLGDDALNRDDLENAQINYALAVNENPRDTNALVMLANVHFKQSSLSVAAKLAGQAIRLDPDKAAAYELLGLVALMEEDYIASEEFLQNAHALNENRERTLTGLGIVMDLTERHTHAQQYFKDALKLTGNKAQLENNLGYSYYLDNDLDAAIDHFQRATSLAPDYHKAWSNLALALSRSGRYDEARLVLGRVGDAHQVSNNLGFLALLHGETELASQEFKQSIKLAPSYYARAAENMSLVGKETPKINQQGAVTRTTSSRKSDLTQLVQESQLINNEPVGRAFVPAAGTLLSDVATEHETDAVVDSYPSANRDDATPILKTLVPEVAILLPTNTVDEPVRSQSDPVTLVLPLPQSQ